MRWPKQRPKPGEDYGEGAEGGLVATEAANNATVGGTLVPTLSLGIPGDASSAMLLGALLILGFIPGPAMFENNPDVVGGIFMVYLAANVFLLIAGILATPIFVYVLRIPKVYLIPSILLLCSIGTFAPSGFSLRSTGHAGFWVDRHTLPSGQLPVGTCCHWHDTWPHP